MKALRLRAALAGAAALAGLAAAPLPAAADPPPRGVPARECRSLAGMIGAADVWWTSFYGERSNLWDQVQSYGLTACFPSEAECKAWLYWAQSDFPDRMTSTPCRRGL